MDFCAADFPLVADVCRRYGVTLDDIRSRVQTRTVTVARAELCSRLRADSAARGISYSYPEIGRLVGHHHTSVMAAIRRHRERATSQRVAPWLAEAVWHLERLRAAVEGR